MSWAGLANNQTVSFSNLKDAVITNVFIAQFGFFSTLEQTTKNNINACIVVDGSFAPFAAKGNNQLVVKSDLKASLNAIGLGERKESPSEACSVSLFVEQAVDFDGTLGIGTQINQTVPVLGNISYFLIVAPIGHPNYLNVIGINDDNEVAYLEDICNF